MASQIPSKEDLGQTPTSRSGAISVQPAQDYMPKAVEGFAQNLAQAGADVAYVERNRQLIKDQIDQHEWNSQAATIAATQGDENDVAVHNMPPGGVGVLDQQTQSWKTKVDTFRKTVPPEKWPTLESYLTKQGAIQSNQLRNQLYPEQDRFYGAKQDVITNQHLDLIRRSPGNKAVEAANVAEATKSIDENPYLTPRAKEYKKSLLPGLIATNGVAGVLGDPEQSKHILDDPAGGPDAPAAEKVVIPPQYPLFSKTQATPKVPGMVVPGNIDLTKRPTVHNDDGSISTVYTTSYSPKTGPNKGKEVLIPQVPDEGGRVMKEREAREYWEKKGQNLGVFDSADAANAYAKILHEQLYDTANKPVGGDLTKPYTLTPEQAGFLPAAKPADDLKPPPGLSKAGLEAWKRANQGDKGHLPQGAPYVPSAAEKRAEITTGDVGTSPAATTPAAAGGIPEGPMFDEHGKLTPGYKTRLQEQGVLAGGAKPSGAAATAPAAPTSTSSKVNALVAAAREVGADPVDLATLILYESGGDPQRWGGTGGAYYGLIQAGGPERKKFGITPGMTFEQQLPGAVRYLKARGFKPGMGMMDLYSTVNAGSPGLYNASDGNGTVRSHVQRMDRDGFRKKAIEFLGGKYVPGESPFVSQHYRPDDFADGGFNRSADWVRRNYPDAPPETVYKLADSIVTQLKQEDHVTTVEKESVRKLMDDDFASMQSTGQPVAGLSPQRVGDVLGADQQAQFEENRAYAGRYYAATHDFNTLAPQQIQDRLDSMQPIPGSPGFAKQEKLYASGVELAKKLQDRREKDPAESVSGTPTVALAQHEAYANPTPQSAQTLIAARMAAQAAAGIPEPSRMPVTQDEALVLGAQMLASPSGGELEPMKALYNHLEATFGDLAPRVMMGILKATKANDAIRKVVADIFASIGKGDGVTPQLVEKFHGAQREGSADAVSQLFAVPPPLPSHTSQGERVEPTTGENVFAPTGAPPPKFSGSRFGPAMQKAAGNVVTEDPGGPSNEDIADLRAHRDSPAVIQEFNDFFKHTGHLAADYLGSVHPAARRGTPQSVFDAAGIGDPSIAAHGGVPPKAGAAPKPGLLHDLNPLNIRQPPTPITDPKTGDPVRDMRAPGSLDTIMPRLRADQQKLKAGVQRMMVNPPGGQPPSDAPPPSIPPKSERGGPVRSSIWHDLTGGQVFEPANRRSAPVPAPQEPITPDNPMQRRAPDSLRGGHGRDEIPGFAGENDLVVTGGKENQGFFDWITGGTPETKVIGAKPLASWPTTGDVVRALDNNQFYGQDQKFLEGSQANVIGGPVQTIVSMPRAKNTYPQVFRPGTMLGDLNDTFEGLSAGTKSKLMNIDNPEVKQTIVAAALVANRVPLAAVGFNPRKFFMQIAEDGGLPNADLNIAGVYRPSTDMAITSLAYNSNMVHESVHRGIDILAKAYPAQMMDLLRKLPDEESIVRWVMYTEAGNPEKDRGSMAEEQITKAKILFGEDSYSSTPEKDAMAELNKLAALYYAKKHGKGPK